MTVVLVGAAVVCACPPDPEDPEFGAWSGYDVHGCQAYSWVSNKEPDSWDEWAPNPDTGAYLMCTAHRAKFVAPGSHRWQWRLERWVTETESRYRTVSATPIESEYLGGTYYDSLLMTVLWVPDLAGWAPTTVKTFAKTTMRNSRPVSINWAVTMFNHSISVIE